VTLNTVDPGDTRFIAEMFDINKYCCGLYSYEQNRPFCHDISMENFV
jgi:hypothetical protein